MSGEGIGALTLDESLDALGIPPSVSAPLVADLGALSYSGNALKGLRVNATANGWEFAAPVAITGSDVTTALGYTPTSVTGLTGAQSIAAFKTGLSLVKGDVGLGSVDNTADATKNVLTATKLFTARNINGVAFDGTANITINAVDSTARVPETRTITTTAPLTGGGDLSANRTFAITAASGAAAGSMSAADFTKLSGIAAGATANSTDAFLLARANHTGTQAWGTVTGTPTTLSGYGITDAQPLDSDLTTIAELTATTDNFIVSVGSAWASRTPAQVRTTLGLVIGTNVQAFDADLTTWAAITPGTGVGTALAVNVGSAGAFVTFNGAGGTPSSLTLTNATGLPIAGLVASTSTPLGVGSIEVGHASDTTIARSSAGNIAVEGNLIYRAGGTDVPVADGGTGASTAAGALTNLGLDVAPTANALTYATGWSDFGSGFYSAAYRKTFDGFVTMDGVIKGSGTATTLIGTLPAGYRPSATKFFMALTNGGPVALEVRTDGTIVLTVGASPTTTTYLGLDAIFFWV